MAWEFVLTIGTWLKKQYDKLSSKAISQTVTTSGANSPVNVAGGDLHIGDKISINHNPTSSQSTTRGGTLSEEAKAILVAARDYRGHLLFIEASDGVFIKVGDHDLIPDQSERTVALWRGGLNQLRKANLIESEDDFNIGFRVTDKGYRHGASADPKIQ